MRSFTCAYCGAEFTPDGETPEHNARGDEKTLWFCTEQCNNDWWAYIA